MTAIPGSTICASPFARAASLNGSTFRTSSPASDSLQTLKSQPSTKTPPSSTPDPTLEAPRVKPKRRRPPRFRLVPQEPVPPLNPGPDNVLHPVFVYGSLLPGLHNHGLLQHATFLGYHTTLPQYSMFSMGMFPAVCSGGETSITGGLFWVDSPTLAKLDELESHPGWYRRQPVELPQAQCRAWMYVMPSTDACLRGTKPVLTGDWQNFMHWSTSSSDSDA